MKNIGLILVAGITIPILLLVGAYILWPSGALPQARLVISIDEQVAQVEATQAARQAEVQVQLDQLNQAIRQQQSDFDDQTQRWQTEMQQAQTQVEALAASAQNLQSQITTLEISRTLRLTEQQTQLHQTIQQYEAEINQLRDELARKQAQLDEINLKLKETE
jgi:chromosome segregation ATPase